MNYFDRWGAVRDARKALRKARKAARKLKRLPLSMWQERNGLKAVMARKMRACPTRCEAILYDALKEHGIQFEAQVQIGPYIADALINEGRTVVEVDGPYHDKQKDYDLSRDRYMWNARYRVIRFSNAEVSKDVKDVVKKILKFMAER